MLLSILPELIVVVYVAPSTLLTLWIATSPFALSIDSTFFNLASNASLPLSAWLVKAFISLTVFTKPLVLSPTVVSNASTRPAKLFGFCGSFNASFNSLTSFTKPESSSPTAVCKSLTSFTKPPFSVPTVLSNASISLSAVVTLPVNASKSACDAMPVAIVNWLFCIATIPSDKPSAEDVFNLAGVTAPL